MCGQTGLGSLRNSTFASQNRNSPEKAQRGQKKSATTAEAMLANWVQRHAAFLLQNPARRTYKYGRTYKYAGKKKKKRNIADEETTRKLIAALEEESIKYETYFKLIIARECGEG